MIVGEDFHFGHERKGNVDLLVELGARSTGSRSRAWTSSASTGAPAGAADRVSFDRDPPGARRRRPRRRPTRCSADPTRSGASSPMATSEGASSGFRPPTCRCRATSCCPPTASTPAGSSGPTAACCRRPCRSGAGRRSTRTPTPACSRCNIIDFDGDLYDESVRVRFVERLRGEEKFDGIEPLIEQMRRDVERAREILGHPGPPE